MWFGVRFYITHTHTHIYIYIYIYPINPGDIAINIAITTEREIYTIHIKM